MNVVEVRPGSSPLILSFPHTGTHVPPEIWERLNDNGKIFSDTDWHIDRLYAGLLPNATTVRATFHRYVIDANRDPEGSSLYPGQNTTGLIPETDFDGAPIWRDGESPVAFDRNARLTEYFAPYHEALIAEIDRVHALHGVAILYDCHSIRSRIPFLFDGTLPDFNIGTDNGATCDPRIEAAAVAVTRAANSFTSILNGRFKGGWTTRHYGTPVKLEQSFHESRPGASSPAPRFAHAIQMELAQSTYLKTQSPPFEYDNAKADKLRVHLQTLLQQLESIAPQVKSK